MMEEEEPELIKHLKTTIEGVEVFLQGLRAILRELSATMERREKQNELIRRS